ncbi:hypothetical protein llg_25500 [Luteolibacter sp. LG18]|nr:hypothetical protein llg_25500 [Luteolibacter sp. LG18]
MSRYTKNANELRPLPKVAPITEEVKTLEHRGNSKLAANSAKHSNQPTCHLQFSPAIFIPLLLAGRAPRHKTARSPTAS